LRLKKNSLVAILFILSFCFSQNVKSAAAIVDTSLLSNIKNKAEAMLDRADSLYNNDQDSAAIKSFEDALDLFLIINDSSKIDYCNYSLGLCHWHIDSYNIAIDYFKKTLSSKNKKDDRFLKSYYYVSDSYYFLGEIDSSVHYLEKAYILAKPLNELDWIKDILQDLVSIYLYENVNSEKAIYYLEEEADLFAGLEPYVTAASYHTIGTINWDEEDYNEAIKSYEKSKNIWVKYISNYQDSLSYFYLLNNLGEMYHYIGNYDSLETIQSEIIDIGTIKNANTIDERIRLDMMFDFYNSVGRDTEIFNNWYLELRKKIRKKIMSQKPLPNNMDLARLYQELAFTFKLNIDDTDSAAYYWEKSLEYYQSLDISNLPTNSLIYDSNMEQEDIEYQIMNCRIELSGDLKVLGDDKYSNTLLEQNISFYKEMAAHGDPSSSKMSNLKINYISSIGNLGTNYISMENYDKAIEYFEQAASLKELNADWLTQDMFWIAYCYYFKKDYKKSIEYFKKELGIHKKKKRNEKILESHYNIAESYNMLGQYGKSIVHLDSAIYILDKLINSLGVQNKINLLDSHINIVQLQVYNYFIMEDNLKLISFIEKYRSLVIKEKLAINKMKSSYNIKKLQPSLSDEECIILFANVDMTNLYNSMNNPEIIHPIIIYIDKDNIVAKKISITDTSNTRLNMDKVMELEIKYLLNNSIIDRSNIADKRQKMFFNIFFGSIEHLLINKKKINFLVDGSLYLLPLELLIDANDNYLINSFDISYLSSLQLFINKRLKVDEDHKTPSILAIGSPIISETPDNSINSFLNEENVRRIMISKIHSNKSIKEELAYMGYAVWDNLPGALDEISNISKQFNNVRTLTGANATELSVKILNDLNDYDIIHFATHSMTIDGIPQASSIVLMPSEKSDDDGYLNISEISKLNIESSFINLASCESGTGEIFPGQGINSFIQAFEYAGAQSVLVSLWPIDDQSTSVFMTSFYSKIASGYYYDHALAEVKREFISGEYGEEYKKPYYWAPFVYYGK